MTEILRGGKMMKVRVKICCISSIAEAQIAVRCGADALGLVGAMPTGPGVVADDLIHDIIKTVPPPIAHFLLTSETTAEGIIAHLKKTHANTIQIVDDTVSAAVRKAVRAAMPMVKIVQVIHVLTDKTVDEALLAAETSDILLLDSGNPAARELGGTGRTHNWDVSRRIVDQSHVPVFLAGGLGAANVRAAIEYVQPFGVDLCSSVRTEGGLDERKLAAFFEEIRL